MKGGKSKSGGKQTHRMLSVRKCKAAKEPKMPCLPYNDYFIFLNEYIKKFREQHTTDSDFRRAALAKWEAMSDADKAPYKDKADELFAKFLKEQEEYKNFMLAKRAAEAAIKAKSKAAEELGMNLSGLIIRQ